MKFILAINAVFLFFSFTFGQAVSPAADDKIYAETRQLFKDAETDFAPIRGDVASRTSEEIIYKTTKTYFESARIVTKLKFYNESRIDELMLSGSGRNAQSVFDFLEARLKSKSTIKPSGNGNEFFISNTRIAQTLKHGDVFYIWLYSNRSAWSDFNKAIDFFSDFMFPDFEAEFKGTLASASEEHLKHCLENAKNKQYKQAIESCTFAIIYNEKSIEAYLARGNAYLNTPDEKERDSKELTTQNSIGINEELAEKDFIKVTELEPKSSDNFVRLAEVQMKIYTSIHWDDAIANLEKARQLNPNNAIIYYDLGEAWREFVDGDFTKVREYRNRAIANFTKYISLKPSDYKGYLGRGLTYFKEDKYEEAIADLSKYIQSGQMNDQAFSARGQSYLELEKYPQAIDDLTKAIKIHVFSPKFKGDTDDLKHDVYWSRAEAYKALGKNKEACQDLKAIGEECN